MKRLKAIKIVILFILLVFSLCLINNYKDCFKRPYIWGLKSARIDGLRLRVSGEGISRSLSFDLNNHEQYRILSDIVNELGIGKIVYITESNQEFIHPGGSGPIIELCFRNGAVIQVKSSVTFTMGIEDGGNVTRSKLIKDQVTLYVNYLQEPIRIIALKTKKLIDEDLGNVINLIILQQKMNDINI